MSISWVNGIRERSEPTDKGGEGRAGVGVEMGFPIQDVYFWI